MVIAITECDEPNIVEELADQLLSLPSPTRSYDRPSVLSTVDDEGCDEFFPSSERPWSPAPLGQILGYD